MKVNVVILCVFGVVLFQPVCCFEPISFSIVSAITAGLGIKYYDKLKLNTYCKYRECCNADVIPFDVISLKDKLETKLFGQHVVSEYVFKAVASHYEKIETSKKPLVLTFHGTQGTGKNYVASMIAEAIFEKGTGSSYYHIFHGSQYYNRDKSDEHRDKIKQEILDGIDHCQYSIFVFDEVDKMPPGIFDSITSMLDHHTLVRGRDFRKAIFIFLSNYGGEEITKILFNLVNKGGLFRHDTKLHHFEEIMRVGVYNRDGGLKETDLIRSAVIDFYIPFLPLEAKHIIQCIKEEYKNCDRRDASEEMIDEILNYIGFHSVTKFAHTGCKTVYAKVQAECYN